jgi:hypothetical protein
MRRFVSVALMALLAPVGVLAQQTPTNPPTPAPAGPAAPASAAPTAATTTAPASGTSSSAPTPPAARRRPSPWAASQLAIQTSANWDFFDRSYRPSSEALSTLDFFVSLRPRYRINRQFQLRARWDFNLEFTNSDTTQTYREPRMSDPVLDLWFLGMPPLGDVRLALAAGFLFPVSPETRAQTLIIQPRLLAQVAWGTEALGGEIALIGQLIYSHRFLQYTTPGVRGDFPYARSTLGQSLSSDVGGLPNVVNNQLIGLTNVHDQLTWIAIVSATWGKWSPGLAMIMTHQWAYDVTRAPGVPAPGPNEVGAGTHVRQLSTFFGWLDYVANSWFTLEVGYFMSRRLLRDDGTWGNPIYDPYQDWRVYLNANIVLDKLFEAITGSGQGEGGVIRTHNTPRHDATVRF